MTQRLSPNHKGAWRSGIAFASHLSEYSDCVCKRSPVQSRTRPSFFLPFHHIFDTYLHKARVDGTHFFFSCRHFLFIPLSWMANLYFVLS